MNLARITLVAALLSLAPLQAGANPPAIVEFPLDVHSWRIVPSESGKVDYYNVVQDPAMPYIHARYLPPYDTAVLGVEIPEAERQRARKLRWTWRAITLPNGGDECASGKGDSAAVIYVAWRRGLRTYALKYVWSAVGRKGQTQCDRKRSPFVAQDTIILESGGPLNAWVNEEIDLKTEFRNHFENGDQNADVPDLRGVALMTDGDQTASESSADYAGFKLVR
ncbi:MAG TPA: DUF3047 domain-containing protein [Polyangiaceae bacterium]